MTERPSYTINFLLQRLVGCLHFTVCLLCTFMPFCMCVPVVLWYAALTEFLAAGFENSGFLWGILQLSGYRWQTQEQKSTSSNTGAEINFIKHTVVFRCTREDQSHLYLRLVYPDHWDLIRPTCLTKYWPNRSRYNWDLIHTISHVMVWLHSLKCFATGFANITAVNWTPVLSNVIP